VVRVTDQTGAWDRAAKMVREGTVPRITPAGVAGFKPASERGDPAPSGADSDSDTPGGTSGEGDAAVKATIKGEDLAAAEAGTGSSAGNSTAEDG
jgi:hypothetical protein